MEELFQEKIAGGGARCLAVKNNASLTAHLCDFFCDVVRPVFDLWRDDGFLRCRRRVSLLVVPFGEGERDQGDLVDGAVLVDVGIRRGAKQAGLHVVKWTC